MFRGLVLAAAAIVLVGCAKAPPEDTCKTPDFTPKAASGTYAAEKEAVTICVRKAAFGLAKAGGDIRHAGEAAVGQCAAEEAAVGVKSGDRIYEWQRKELHDSLIHTAQIAATQARATGCGLPPGAAKDTL